MILLIACSSPSVPVPVPVPVPVRADDRWAAILTLAAPETCQPAPTALTAALSADPRDPEEIRLQLLAWHTAHPAELVRLDSPSVAGTNGALAWSKWITDADLPAWAHLLSSVDRCGPVEVAGLVATHADRLCRERGAAFAAPAKGAGFTPLRALAAREAVRQVEAASGAPDAQVEDLKRWLEAWVLDGDAATLPPVERGTRPLVALTRGAMEADWLLVATKRASFEACLGG
jgi:hypothetical protein